MAHLELGDVGRGRALDLARRGRRRQRSDAVCGRGSWSCGGAVRGPRPGTAQGCGGTSSRRSTLRRRVAVPPPAARPPRGWRWRRPGSAPGARTRSSSPSPRRRPSRPRRSAALLPGHAPWVAYADAARAEVALARGDVAAAATAGGAAMQALEESLTEDAHLPDVAVRQPGDLRRRAAGDAGRRPGLAPAHALAHRAGDARRRRAGPLASKPARPGAGGAQPAGWRRHRRTRASACCGRRETPRRPWSTTRSTGSCGC